MPASSKISTRILWRLLVVGSLRSNLQWDLEAPLQGQVLTLAKQIHADIGESRLHCFMSLYFQLLRSCDHARA